MLLALDTSINCKYWNITGGQRPKLFRTLNKKTWTTRLKRKQEEMIPCSWGPHCQPAELPGWRHLSSRPPPTIATAQPRLYTAVSYFSPVAGAVPLTNLALTEDPQSYKASQSPRSLIILGNVDHLLVYCSCLDSKPLRSVLALYFIAT